MRSVKMKGKKGKIETNGSDGESEENGGLLSLNASGSEESKEADKSLTKGKRSRASRSKGNDSVAEDPEDNGNLEDDAEQENGNAKSSKRRKKMANDKPKATQNDGDDDNNDGADESKKEEEEDEDNEEEYEVEKIVSHRIIKGKRQFLVRWKGYNEDSDTWEQEKDLHCPELIEEFLADEEAEEQAADSSNKKVKPTKTKSPKVEKKGRKPASKNNKTAKNGNKETNGDKDDEGDDDDDVDPKKEYEVEKILDVYFKKNKEREFLIRWKGFNANDDTWEPEKNLNCAQLIETFMSKVDKAKSLNPRELRTNPQHTKRYTLSTSEPGRRLSRRNVGKQRATYHQCDE